MLDVNGPFMLEFSLYSLRIKVLLELDTNGEILVGSWTLVIDRLGQSVSP